MYQEDNKDYTSEGELQDTYWDEDVAYIVVWTVLVSKAFPSLVLAFFVKPVGVDIASIRFFSFSSIPVFLSSEFVFAVQPLRPLSVFFHVLLHVKLPMLLGHL